MNNCTHGLYSTKDLLPGECPIERQELVDDITAAAKPGDGVQRLLTERIIKTAWRVRRGERAQDARATKSVNALVEGAASEEARRADALGATLDENVDAYHELLTFPAGVAYILDQWSIILESLSQGLPLLASTRRRCFSLVGKNARTGAPKRPDRDALVPESGRVDVRPGGHPGEYPRPPGHRPPGVDAGGRVRDSR